MKILLKMSLLMTFALGACATPETLHPAGSNSASLNNMTIFVTRHLQKAEGDDPPLSIEGIAAAERLANMLSDEGIVAIYATPTRRAVETAAPLSRKTKVAITEYDPQNPQALIGPVSRRKGAVLVVGHSNTVPDLIVRFGGHTRPELTEQDYGRVFMIDATGAVDEFKLD